MKKINTPLTNECISDLKAGDRVLLSGIIYTARDVAHARFVQCIKENKKLPFDFKDQVIYYTGPTPSQPDKIIGSCGPTTSYRMDKFTPILLDTGLKGMIGKGARSEDVKQSIIKNKAVYFFATGGAGALISKCVIKSEVIAYDELGAEAVRKLEVKDFPIIVINDIYGGDYEVPT